MATRAEIENMNFGVAAEMGPYGQQQGALRDILRITSGSSANADRAIALANQLMPPPEEADPYEAMFRYFSGMAKAASQPGATVLSSALAPMDVPLDYYTAKKKELKQSEQARMQAALSLGPSLKAPVVKATYGKPDFYMVSRLVDGKLTEAVETPLTPKQFDDLQPQIKDGSVVITAVPKAGTSGAQSPLGKLIADYDGGAGSMTKAQFDAQFEKLTNIATSGGGAQSPLGKLIADYDGGAGSMTKAQFNAQYTKLTNVADGSETALEKLEAQAIAGGLEKGTDAYKEWILTGGKPSSGFSLESDGKGGFTFVQGDVAGQRSGRVDKGYIQKTMTDGTVVQQVVPGSLAFTEVETQRSGFVGDIAQANFLLETVDAIIGRPEGGGQTGMPPNPNLDAVLGSVQGKIPMNLFLDQGKTDVLVKIEFLKSNAFMQAFASLKGGGQITEKEGDAATAALAMLNRVQDPKEFTKGLTEFANIIRRGREKAKRLTASLPQIAGTISGGENINLNFDTMSPSQLRLIDVKSLTPKQRLALAKKLGI
jgi:hypothetical protein